MNAGDLTDHVALVTGGGSGIGAALCRRLAARGASVVVADLDDDGAQAVAADVDGIALHLDVADRASWNAAMATVLEHFGRLDLVALNAGVMIRPRGADISDDPFPWMAERYELVRGVNIDGVALGVMSTTPLLEAGGGGRIVATSSGVGLTPLPTDPIYSMTKHAVIGLVRSLAESLGERGVTIGAVCPGGVDTPMISPDLRASGRSFASPDEIAAGLEAVLDKPAAESGGIWVAREGQDLWRYEFAAHNQPPGGTT